MEALIRKEKRVLCPYCTCDQYIILRRKIEDDDGNVLTNKCRCEACGDYFVFSEDKEGTPIDTENPKELV